MKVILYMAVTVNGMIAKEDDSTPWSEVEWESYNNIVKKYGNLIIGRRTYELMSGDNSFSKLGNPLVVVLTSKKLKSSKNVFCARNPKEALDIIAKHEFKTALVGGGGQINSLFMKQNLVDEIYLDVEPLVFGKGVKLFADSEFEAKLELLEVKKMSDNLVQLHYKVK